MNPLELQSKVRHNALEQQSSIKELLQWEKEADQRDNSLKRRQKKQKKAVRSTSSNLHLPVRAGGGSISIQNQRNTSQLTSDEKSFKNSKTDQNKTAADHTYDKGYKKWENFDVEGALDEIDESCSKIEFETQDQNLTPASIINLPSSNHVQELSENEVKAPLVNERGEREEEERKCGNEAFKNGDFEKALVHYTRCIGLKRGNYLAFSNRSQVHITLKDWAKGERDASKALSLHPDHLKSYLRRAQCRAMLGKVRGGLLDLKVARIKGGKGLGSKEGKMRDQLKGIIMKAPLTRIEVVGWGEWENNNNEIEEEKINNHESQNGTSSLPPSSTTTAKMKKRKFRNGNEMERTLVTLVSSPQSANTFFSSVYPSTSSPSTFDLQPSLLELLISSLSSARVTTKVFEKWISFPTDLPSFSFSLSLLPNSSIQQLKEELETRQLDHILDKYNI